MPKVLLLFIDGVGLGEDRPASNPFARFRTAFLPFYTNSETRRLPFDGRMTATAVDMGIPGLPQSATGQTALLCGVKSSQIVGRHISGYPTPTLRKIIDRESIFLKLTQIGRVGTFANALSHEYFARFGDRISATSRALIAGQFAPKMLTDLSEHGAISHDLTNSFLAQMGHTVPRFSIAESAGILSKIVRDVDFCLFEFFLSDRAGHACDWDAAEQVIVTLRVFLENLLPQLDLGETTVILTSDHGNMEDLTVTTHTHNAVPTVVWGAGREHILSQAEAIEQITPAILALLA